MTRKKSHTSKKFKSILLIVILGFAGYFSKGYVDWQGMFRQVVSQQDIIPKQFIPRDWLGGKSSHKSHSSSNLNPHNYTDEGGTCALNLYENRAPIIEIKKMAQESKILCNYAYAGRVSFISKSNLYSAEHLTAKRVRDAKKIERINPFHADSRLAERQSASLQDYQRSGYDRGHLAPNADMATAQEQYQSFSLANMVPQKGEHNRKTWSKVEKITRQIAKRYGSIFVVTMPVYQAANGKIPARLKAIGKNKVYIPQFMAKAIYVPKIQQAVVVLSPNDDSHRVQLLSLARFQQLAHIQVFPTLSNAIQRKRGTFFKWQSGH